ncbi:hypothetical protein AB1Y20_012086 [Prymnesium parvum]|uniref:RNA helicase n=1 Tax=Prymnesium parvum TaxID=97485 RepID=A0AB34IQ78_PRYPA
MLAACRAATTRPSARLAAARLSTAASSSLPAHFGGVPMPPRLLAAVHRLGYAAPLPIQSSAMRRVYAGESLALHSETGSGKTLAYLLPLLARLSAEPRQVLVVLPSYTLAMQTLELGEALGYGASAGGQMGLLRSRSDPAASLLQAEQPLVLLTAGQLAQLLPTLEAEGSTFVDELRATLRTVVIDEVDTVLQPVGKGYMLNRSRRTRSLQRLPAAQVFRRLVERRKSAAAAKRVQLVIATATLSKRVVRDLSFLVRRECGKIGLAIPAGASGEERQAGRLLLEDESEESSSEEARPDARVVARRRRADEEGWGERMGVLYQGVPRGISHEMPHEKSAAIAALARQSAGTTLLVVDDDRPLHEVISSLRQHGVRHAFALPSLAIAAVRHHSRATAAAAGGAIERLLEAQLPPRLAWAAPPSARRGEAEEEAEEEWWREEEERGWGATCQQADERDVHCEARGGTVARAGGEREVESAKLREAAGKCRLLVAHETAIRGLDLPQVQRVISMSVPKSVESYIHVSGRTGRAGKQGTSTSVLTQPELAQAGTITRSLRGTKFRMLQWNGKTKAIERRTHQDNTAADDAKEPEIPARAFSF